MRKRTINIRLVHASTECATGSRSSPPSYLSSTRSHGVPLRHIYVFGCVLISIVVSPTFGTIPFTNIEGQLFNNVPTTGAHLTGREESVNQFQALPVHLTLVSDLTPEHAYSHVRNCTSKAMVGHHTSDIQIFNTDHVKSPNEIGGEFM